MLFYNIESMFFKGFGVFIWSLFFEIGFYYVLMSGAIGDSGCHR